MRAALRKAGKYAAMDADEIDYVNPHGSSTPLNDKFETWAIKDVFGDHAQKLVITSTKSMVGHMFGAAGAVEAMAAVKAIETGIIPPTINYETPDPDCDLDYAPNVARERKVRAAMSNSFGLGGPQRERRVPTLRGASRPPAAGTQGTRQACVTTTAS